MCVPKIPSKNIYTGSAEKKIEPSAFVCVRPAAATCRGIALAKPEASRGDGSAAKNMKRFLFIKFFLTLIALLDLASCKKYTNRQDAKGAKG